MGWKDAICDKQLEYWSLEGADDTHTAASNFVEGNIHSVKVFIANLPLCLCYAEAINKMRTPGLESREAESATASINCLRIMQHIRMSRGAAERLQLTWTLWKSLEGWLTKRFSDMILHNRVKSCTPARISPAVWEKISETVCRCDQRR